MPLSVGVMKWLATDLVLVWPSSANQSDCSAAALSAPSSVCEADAVAAAAADECVDGDDDDDDVVGCAGPPLSTITNI